MSLPSLTLLDSVAPNPAGTSVSVTITAEVDGLDPTILALLPLNGPNTSQVPLTDVTGNTGWAAQVGGVFSNTDSTLGFATSWWTMAGSGTAGGFTSTNASIDLSSSDRTWEGWFYCTTMPASDCAIFCQRYAAEAAGWVAAVNNNGALELFVSQTIGAWFISNVGAAGGFTALQWNHIALVNHGGTWTLYCNGVAQVTGTFLGTPSNDSGGHCPVVVGNNSATSANNFQGYIQDFRISNFARYTANFTPPAIAFTGTAHPGSPVATGSFSFYDGATLLGSPPLNGSGVATWTQTYAVGTHIISAVYSGDGNYAAGPSVPASVSLLVALAPLGVLLEFDVDPTNPQPYRWHSKQFYVNYPTVFRVARVTANSYANTTLNLFADGVQYASVPVTSQVEFALPQPQSATPAWPATPSAMCFRYFEFEIVGSDDVTRVQIAEDFEELT